MILLCLSLCKLMIFFFLFFFSAFLVVITAAKHAKVSVDVFSDVVTRPSLERTPSSLAQHDILSSLGVPIKIERLNSFDGTQSPEDVYNPQSIVKITISETLSYDGYDDGPAWPTSSQPEIPFPEMMISSVLFDSLTFFRFSVPPLRTPSAILFPLTACSG